MIIIRPIITEKSMKDVGEHKYTFQVAKKANKNIIKQAVEKMFSVDVIDIATRIVKGESKRIGPKRLLVKSSAWKKAIIRVKDDQKIDMFGKGETEDKK